MMFPDLVEKYRLGDPGVDLSRGCDDVVNSVLADGIACARLQDLALDGSYNDKWTTVKRMSLTARPDTGWYKIVCVMGVERTGDADFHFCRQDIMDMYDIYSEQLHGYHDIKRPDSRYWFGSPIWQTCKGNFFKTAPSPYDTLGIHPFAGSRYIESVFTDTSRNPNVYGLKGGLLKQNHSYISATRSLDGQDPKLNRPRTNLDLHVSRIPDYILAGRNFIPSPFWLIAVDPFVKDCAAKVIRRQQELVRLYEGRPGYELHKKTVDAATNDCLSICNGRRGMPPIHSLIGTFSEKLGFGTGALNTDGAFKINFDPTKACRYRGGVHYDTVCTAFAVMYNHGSSTVSAFDQPKKNRQNGMSR